MDEVRAILDEASEHLKRAIYLSYYTGLRPGKTELPGLKYSDVHFSGQLHHRTRRRQGRPARKAGSPAFCACKETQKLV